jgi:hypothetical protein
MATAALPNEEEVKKVEDYQNHLNQYSYSEESKKALRALQTAFEEKDLIGKNWSESSIDKN